MARWLCTALIGGLIVGLAAGGCTQQSATTQPVIIGGLFNLSGVMAPYDGPASQGVALAIKLQNAAGGIRGRTIQYNVQDTGTDPAKITAGTNEAIRQGPAALIGYN